MGYELVEGRLAGGRDGMPEAEAIGERRRIDYTRAILAASERFVKANPATVDAVLRVVQPAVAPLQ